MDTKVELISKSSNDSLENLASTNEKGISTHQINNKSFFNMGKELIPIMENNGRQAVNARDLYNFLEIGKDFSSWIKAQIERCYLVENVDFIVFTQKGENHKGGRPLLEYVLTIESAKEISMMSQCERGKQARLYFIECERKLREKNFYSNPIPTMTNEDREVRLLEARVKAAELYMSISNRTSILEFKQILDSYAANTLAGKEILPLPEANEKTYSATEIGNMLGVSANKIGKIANRYKFKTPEYGKLFYDKSKYSNKEVETFRYYKCAIDAFREILIDELQSSIKE